MRPIPLSNIELTDPFWSRWQSVLLTTTLPAMYRQIVDTGRIEHFRKVARKETGGFEGAWFNDSDVYKFLEACAYALARGKDKKLSGYVDEMVAAIADAQDADGYVNTYIQLEHPTARFKNLNMGHEMYCGGHMIEAGVALFECTGDRRLLDVSVKFADHLYELFGPDKRKGYDGHEEIELALLKLERATKNAKYRELAKLFVERRGTPNSPFEAEFHDPAAMAVLPFQKLLKEGEPYNGEYYQDHTPIREHTKVVGHAVRAMYLYIAAAELADGKDDVALEEAMERAWSNLTTRRMYVTGGIGASASNEGFTEDFDLPNLSAYAETCASCGLVLWGQAMLEMTANGEYADTIERALYNGVLVGISLAGDHFFYANPLESRGSHTRTPWFWCACCPPNVARIIGSASNYIAGASDSAFYLSIPAGLKTTVKLGGVDTKFEVKSNYPWSGKFEVHVNPAKPAEFDLYIRIPDWSDDASTELPDAEEEADYEAGYAKFSRTWKSGDVLTVDLGMAPKWVQADPRVRDNLGRVALTCGPLIYAAEEHDLGFAPQLLSVDTESAILTGEAKGLDGIEALSLEGFADIESFSDGLYAEDGTTEVQGTGATVIPYYAWNNRGPNSMQVWLRKA